MRSGVKNVVMLSMGVPPDVIMVGGLIA